MKLLTRRGVLLEAQGSTYLADGSVRVGGKVVAVATGTVTLPPSPEQ